MRDEHKILSDIQTEILKYLEEHPDAADTAEGVRQWWLFQRMATYSQDKVLAALHHLKAAGLIEAITLKDGREVYSLCRPGRENGQSITLTNTQEAKS